jgi:hypothetical protein
MKTIYNIYEGILDNIDIAIDKADRTIKDIRKMQSEYAYLNNLPNLVKPFIIGGVRGVYKKYFISNVPKLHTDRHSILSELYKHPERLHDYTKLDTDGDYLAAYILQTEFKKPVEDYNLSNISDSEQFAKEIEAHLFKIMNAEGKDNLRVFVDRRGYNGRDITVKLFTKDRTDLRDRAFKALGISKWAGAYPLLEWSFTKGQYYYK